MKAVFRERVSILSEYETEVHAPNFSMRLPSVIAPKDFVLTTRFPAFTRFNVFLRDSFRCQYCGHQHPTQELTFDHVVPRSRGGRTAWDNVVTACGKCNLRRSLVATGMRYVSTSQTGTPDYAYLLQENGRAFPPNFLHESWRDFLYWDAELEFGNQWPGFAKRRCFVLGCADCKE